MRTRRNLLKEAPGYGASPALFHAHQVAVCYMDAQIGGRSLDPWTPQLVEAHRALYEAHPLATITRPMFDAFAHAGLRMP